MIELSLIMFYFSLTMFKQLFSHFCVAQVFTKYRLSFKVIKRDLFKPRVEFIGHELTTSGTFSALSKLKLIKNWSLPLHVIYFYPLLAYLDSVTSIVLSLSIISTYFKKYNTAFIGNHIPIISWTPQLITSFYACKITLVSSPLLFRYNTSKLVFFKTD